jgi:hypothetical protein
MVPVRPGRSDPTAPGKPARLVMGYWRDLFLSYPDPYERPSDAAQRNRSPVPAKVIAPLTWVAQTGADDEPPFDHPCIERCGRVVRRDALFLHFCVVCGAWGAYGFGVTGRFPGRWFCRDHRPQTERLIGEKR